MTGVPQRDIVAAARTLGPARNAIVLTARGAEQQSQGVAQRAVVHQPRPGDGARRTAVQRLRLPDRSGQRTGRARARAESRSAPGLPAARRHRGARARSRRCGESRRKTCRVRAVRPTSCSTRWAAIAACAACSSWDRIRSSRRRTRRTSKSGSRALDFLVVCDFFLSETARLADVVLPSAQWAEEDGTMTNLEGPGASGAGRSSSRRKASAPTSRSSSGLARALGSAEGLSGLAARRARRAACSATAGAPADYSGITPARIDREHGVFWPCPRPTPARHAAPVRRSLPRRRTGARASIACSRSVRPNGRMPTTRSTSRPAACWRSTSRERRRAVSPGCAAPRGTPRRRCTRARRSERASTNGAEITIETRRGRASFRLKTTHGIREDTIFVPFHWPDEQSANRLTNPALDPISRMPEFKVCAAPRSPRAARRARATMRDARSDWSSSATAWPAPAWSKTSSRATPARSTSRCSATSPTATTTGSCSPACSPARTIPRTSSSTRWRGTNRPTSGCTPACA